ncbi:MAG TPA: SRPBCC family protein [Dehalococcoidia bacterium]|nr:SRPBCC family protein [Dehalococcoidia bacterium]
MSRPESVYVTYIHATPERVWQGLTDPDFTEQYWGGCRIESDWRAGSRVETLGPNGVAAWAGEVLAADPPRLLSYTFDMLISEEHRAEAPSRVTFVLEQMGEVVRLTLTHDRLEAGATYESTRYGWAALMSSLKSLLETGRALPFARLGFGPSRTPEGRD